MKSTIVHIKVLAVLAGFLLLPCGCGSTKPAKFYRMQPSSGGYAQSLSTPAALTASVGIGPVEVPGYLDHPQIVTRKPGSELGYSEYNRWAGSLRGNISDMLVEDVSAALAGEGVSVHAWDSRMPLDYQVEVRVIEFEGVPGKNVRLTAVWTVIRPGERMVVASRRSVIEKHVSNTDYASYVEAMGGATSELGREIADVLHTLNAGKK
jgi:uncharacterized protein